VPARVGTRTDWRKLVVGDWHACALATDDSLWCWGHGDEGQTGDPNLFQHNAPSQVGTTKDWADVAAGDHFTCAIKRDGTRWCFGGNSEGQLGNRLAWQTAFLAVP
jgi:alpha-tubulin suppressor-like RCC1 family protein